MINQKDEAFNRCWSKYYKEHSWNYMDEELSSDLAYYFWKSALEQPTQEPVAYFKKWEDKSGEHKDIKFSNSEGYKPLYTHPKEWQGLNKYEIIAIDNATNDLMDFARAIEAKLKEENHE